MNKRKDLSSLEKTVFYSMDRSIKSYRQFAQKQIKNHKINITIDQWLLLKTINDHPDLSQKEMSEKVFKDHASVTRMIELLVKRKYLERSFNADDRRRFDLRLTKEGKGVYQKLIPIIQNNRATALDGLSSSDISTLHTLLNKITENCNNTNL